jgi:hypothetical protein
MRAGARPGGTPPGMGAQKWAGMVRYEVAGRR